MDDKKLKITNEIINDAFWLSYILELKRKIDDYNQKEILSLFLLNFASVFCEETIRAGYGGMGKEAITTEKEISNFRNDNLKMCFKTDSEVAGQVVSEMGIDLENYVFDIVLLMADSKIMDINFRSWSYAKEEKTKLLECVISTPNAWMDDIMPNFYATMLDMMKKQTKLHIAKISSLRALKRSYSSYRLFCNSAISNDNKLYILQRYGLVQIVKFMDSLFNENISFHLNKLIISSDIFMAKCKALLIEMFYNDSKNNKSIVILKDIFSQNKNDIPNEFYALNRRLRNNIHYGDCNYMTKSQLKTVMKYQDIYLKNVMKFFGKELTVRFGLRYEFDLWLSKINNVHTK